MALSVFVFEEEPTPVPPTPTPTRVPDPTIVSYDHYSLQSDGNGYFNASLGCEELVQNPFYSLRNSVLGFQVGDQLWTNSSRTVSFDGNGYWYQVGDLFSSSAQKVIKIGEGQIMQIENCPTVAPTPTPTRVPDQTPQEVYKYLMDPCNGEGSYVIAQSNTPKSIGTVYSLSGSLYADQNYTCIRTSTEFPETTILDAASCDGDDGGDKCLIEGTMVQLADGTQTAIETLINDQSLASVVVGNMPDTDTVSQLLSWSQSNPVLSNTTTNMVNKVEYTVDSVINFNNNLITSSKDHLHIIKRSGTWMISKASDILVGDVFIDKNYNEIQITSIQELTGSYKVYKLNVETNDTFIANGIITHNSKPPR